MSRELRAGDLVTIRGQKFRVEEENNDDDLEGEVEVEGEEDDGVEGDDDDDDDVGRRRGGGRSSKKRRRQLKRLDNKQDKARAYAIRHDLDEDDRGARGTGRGGTVKKKTYMESGVGQVVESGGGTVTIIIPCQASRIVVKRITLSGTGDAEVSNVMVGTESVFPGPDTVSAFGSDKFIQELAEGQVMTAGQSVRLTITHDEPFKVIARLTGERIE